MTLAKDFTRQSHHEITIAPYAMREYYFRNCSDPGCPDHRGGRHAHLMVWDTSFWMEPEMFEAVHSLVEGQQLIAEQFGGGKLHPRNLGDMVASLEQCFPANNTAEKTS